MDLNTLIFCGAIGLIIGGIFQLMDKLGRSNLTHENKDSDLAHEVEQAREIFLIGSVEEVRREAYEGIRKINGVKINYGIDSRVIKAKTSINWKTFGDKINVAIESYKLDIVKVTIESKPKVWGTTMDYGKNFDNVEIISKHLNNTFCSSS